MEPHKKYAKDMEKKFAKELTALFVASKASTPIKAVSNNYRNIFTCK